MIKNSYLGYFNISLSSSSKDFYFIEIRSTDKKPIKWNTVSISVFDSWYDELKYTVSLSSDYIWIKVNREFGIGSITFLPEGLDEKYKDFVIFHEYVLKKKFNPVISVLCYPKTKERIQQTKKHILSLHKSGVPVYLCSDMECPLELTELCDGFIYTGPGNLCNIPDLIIDKVKYLEDNNKHPVHIYPDQIKFYNLHGFINGKGSYLWPATNSFHSSVKKLKELGFSHVMLSEGEFELDELDYSNPLDILKNLWDEDIVVDFFYTPGSQYLQCYLWFAELDHLVDSLRDVSLDEKHLPRENGNSNLTAFLLYEKYYMQKILSNSPGKKIRIRTSGENKNLIKNKYWCTERADVILYEDKYFMLEELKTEEKLSFPLYFPNIKNIFPSNSSVNSKSDILDSGSFSLDVRKYNSEQWVILVKNITITQVINLRVRLLNSGGKIIYESEIKNCCPNITYFSIFNLSMNDIKKCGYSVYLDVIEDPFYIGEFEYFY